MFINYSFTGETLYEIIQILKTHLKQDGTKEVVFEVLNPDILLNEYAGSELTINNQTYIYRGYKAWVDLAEILYCKITTPQINQPHTIILIYLKLDKKSSFHTKIDLPKEEKYGANSEFSHIHKNEEPAFLEYYLRALENVNLSKRKRILNLGINSGEEFEVISNLCDVDEKEFVGIDFSSSAIEKGKKRFPRKNFTFYTHDINKLSELELGKFDLIITIGTLQSSGVNFKVLFASLVQNYLEKGGALILGFPNCRWIDGEMIYGAFAPNYNFSEMTLLFKDVYYCKKYLQQKKFRVSISGKNYPFLSATSLVGTIDENSKKV